MKKTLLPFLLTAVFITISSSAHSATIDVAMRNTTFQPQVVTINVGDTVKWTNWDTIFYGTIPHTTTSGTNCTYDGTGWDSGTLLTAESFSFTFNTLGTYPYFCSLHCLTAGMTGTVIVSDAPPPSDRTLTVASSNPGSGVSITVSPNDKNGQGTGTTQLTRTYANGTAVTLTAPETAGGNNFQKWQRNGVDYATTAQTSVTMDADYAMTVIYVAPPPPGSTLFSGLASFPVRATSLTQGSSGFGFSTLTEAFAGTMEFILDDQNAFVTDSSGCLVSFTGDPNMSICIQNLSSLSTQKTGGTDSILLVGTGFFTWTVGGGIITGPAYLDAKGSIKKDATGAIISIAFSGKLGGGEDSGLMFSVSKFRTTVAP